MLRRRRNGKLCTESSIRTWTLVNFLLPVSLDLQRCQVPKCLTPDIDCETGKQIFERIRNQVISRVPWIQAEASSMYPPTSPMFTVACQCILSNLLSELFGIPGPMSQPRTLSAATYRPLSMPDVYNPTIGHLAPDQSNPQGGHQPGYGNPSPLPDYPYPTYISMGISDSNDSQPGGRLNLPQQTPDSTSYSQQHIGELAMAPLPEGYNVHADGYAHAHSGWDIASDEASQGSRQYPGSI